MTESSTDIKMYCSPREVSMTNHWYEHATTDHFWMEWRFEIFRKIIAPIKARISNAIEIGAGSGSFRNQVEEQTGIMTDASDLNLLALKQCPSGLGKKMVFDVNSPPQDLLGTYDAAFLMDVIEHIDDDTDFLKNSALLLKSSGYVIINVPSIPALMSKYDLVAGHRRRYTISEIERLLKSAEFKIIDIRYWGFFMVPLLFIRKLLLLLYKTDDEIISVGFKPPGYVSEKILSFIGLLERILPFRWPLGTSIMCLAQKN